MHALTKTANGQPEADQRMGPPSIHSGAQVPLLPGQRQKRVRGEPPRNGQAQQAIASLAMSQFQAQMSGVRAPRVQVRARRLLIPSLTCVDPDTTPSGLHDPEPNPTQELEEHDCCWTPAPRPCERLAYGTRERSVLEAGTVLVFAVRGHIT